jgi:hypothetical protein
MLIIIKGKNCRLGKTRSEIETNLRKEWGSSSLNQVQIDKCKFLEKRTGGKWFDSEIVDSAEKIKPGGF